MPARRPDPALALRWLAQARWALVGAQALLVVLTRALSPIVLPVGPVVGLLGALVLVDLVASARRRPATPGALHLHLAIDLLVLTGILGLTGGAENPLLSFYLVYVALAAVVLPLPGAWGVTGAAVALEALVVFVARDLPGLDDSPHEHRVHLIGHVLAFDVAAVAVNVFVGRLSAALRASEEDAAQAEKLAALGTLAAGTAHALATPMGAIELLAEEAATSLPTDSAGHTPLALLRGEVRRCRAILDRMLAGDEGADGVTERVGDHVRAWVDDWRAGQAGAVRVEIVVDTGDATVRGGEDGWRDALWTLLDNARTAGDPIRVRAEAVQGCWRIVVEDSGGAVRPEDLARAGQPFFSGWRARKGTGLGLHVARNYARAAGGDLMLEGSDRGARATLTLVRA